MFENPGSKIKRIAKIGFVLESISVIITAMITAIETSEVSWLLTIPLGIATAYLISLVFYAFGELVSSTEENKDANEELLKINQQILQKMAPEAPKATKTATSADSVVEPVDAAAASKPAEAPKATQPAKSKLAGMVAKAPEKKHRWRCECGQTIDQSPCPYCGK